MNKALQATVTIWQGYIPEICCAHQNHTNWKQNSHTKQSTSWRLLTTSSYLVYDYTTSGHMDL
jgi:hypothetical protein